MFRPVIADSSCYSYQQPAFMPSSLQVHQTLHAVSPIDLLSPSKSSVSSPLTPKAIVSHPEEASTLDHTSSPSTHPSKQIPSTLRVLVVDDNATSSKIMGVLLNRLGVAATFLTCGRHVLAHYGFGTTPPSEQPFDVMIIDLMMPHMDGFTTCEKVRWLETNARISPCYKIAVSSLDQSHVDSQGGGLFQSFLQKPVRFDVLRDSLLEVANAMSDVPADT